MIKTQWPTRVTHQINPGNWVNNPDFADMAIDLQLDQEPRDRTIGVVKAVELLVNYIPVLEYTQCVNGSSVILVGLCVGAVGLQDAEVDTAELTKCFERINRADGHQAIKDTFIMPVLDFIEGNVVTPCNAAKYLWAKVRDFCQPPKGSVRKFENWQGIYFTFQE